MTKSHGVIIYKYESMSKCFVSVCVHVRKTLMAQPSQVLTLENK